MPDAAPTHIVVTTTPAAKPWWQSRILWINGIALGLAVAESRLQLLQPVLPVDVFALLAFVLPIVNTVLRSVTSTSLDFSRLLPGAPNQPPKEPQ